MAVLWIVEVQEVVQQWTEEVWRMHLLQHVAFVHLPLLGVEFLHEHLQLWIELLQALLRPQEEGQCLQQRVRQQRMVHLVKDDPGRERVWGRAQLHLSPSKKKEEAQLLL